MKYLLFVLSLMGLSFSGYLSGVKFFSGTCALGETCPYFLGYPACYFGFGMYVAITLLVIAGLSRTIREKSMYLGVLFVGLLGVIFAGYFSLSELPALFNEGLGYYTMVLPTCSWGLVFYLAVVIISVLGIKKTK